MLVDPRILTSKEVNIDNMTLEEYELYELAMSKKKSEVDNDSMIIEEDELYMAMQCSKIEYLLKTSEEWNRKKFRMGVMMKKLGILTIRMKDEVRMEDVEMDEDHEVDHSKTKEVFTAWKDEMSQEK
ncbi:hypothetical protein Tco_1469498 [Tanacetum coccineum]